MSKQDRQKLSILVILLTVLGLTVVLGYRMNQPATTAAVQTPEPKTSTNPPAASDARIRLDLVEKPEDAEDVGKKNVFVYRQPAPPPPLTPRPGAQPPPSQVPSNVGPAPVPIPPGPPVPPPPPPIPLKYQGFATVNSPGGGLTAFLSDDSRHYNVKVGEVLMGRYRIAAISDKMVEVEDLEYNRRQTLPLLK
jgi:hypothetical protein